MIPPHAIFGDPMGALIQQTIYRDTPAAFSCVFCGNSGVTNVKSKPSLAAVVACMMPMMLGICFLCPSIWTVSGINITTAQVAKKRLLNLRNRTHVPWSILHIGAKRALRYQLNEY